MFTKFLTAVITGAVLCFLFWLVCCAVYVAFIEWWATPLYKKYKGEDDV